MSVSSKELYQQLHKALGAEFETLGFQKCKYVLSYRKLIGNHFLRIEIYASKMVVDLKNMGNKFTATIGYTKESDGRNYFPHAICLWDGFSYETRLAIEKRKDQTMEKRLAHTLEWARNQPHEDVRRLYENHVPDWRSGKDPAENRAQRKTQWLDYKDGIDVEYLAELIRPRLNELVESASKIVSKPS